MSRAIAAARPSTESAVAAGQLPTRQSRKPRRPKLIDAPRQSNLAKTPASVNYRSARPPRLIQIVAPFSSRLSRNNGAMDAIRFHGEGRLRVKFADSDEAGHAFQIEAGHPFRFEAGHCSDLKSATWRHSAGREDVVLVFRPGSSAGSTERKEQVPLARREAVPVVNRRAPRATRRALAADAASRAGGPC